MIINKLSCVKKGAYMDYIINTLNFRSTIEYLFRTYEKKNIYYIFHNRRHMVTNGDK